MQERFELFVLTVTRAYKSIQQIKRHKSETLGLKGIHVMCLYFMGQNPDGLTITELAGLCYEDKAAISRTMDALVEMGYANYGNTDAKRRWRSKITITEEGKAAALRLQEMIDQVVRRINHSLSDEELLQFYKVFFAINDELAAYCEELENRE